MQQTNKKNNLILSQNYQKERIQNPSNFHTLNSTNLNKKGILIVDGPPGVGKTESAIDYINSSKNPKTKFIYVTPYLDEVQRIKKSCPTKKFKEPQLKKGTKKNSFFSLLKQGENIVCTHALFDNFDEDCFNLLMKKKIKEYVLIMDEVADVVQQIEITPDELNLLLTPKLNICHIDPETYQLIWDYPDCYMPRFQDIKDKAELGSVYVYANTAFFWTFPTSIFQSFSKVFILTYKYKGQIQAAYYDFFEIPIKYIHIERVYNNKNEIIKFKFEDKIYDYPQKFDIKRYLDLINIYQGKLNEIGDYKAEGDRKKITTKLSKSWYSKTTEDNLTELKNNTVNYFRHIVNSKAEEMIWTTFKDFKNKIKGLRMAKNFVPCNMRATNEYKDRFNLAYLINCYTNPILKNFFSQKDIYIDENEYALSEMLQWIFRSRLRQGKSINIYIPSQRMRELLENWE